MNENEIIPYGDRDNDAGSYPIVPAPHEITPTNPNASVSSLVPVGRQLAPADADQDIVEGSWRMLDPVDRLGGPAVETPPPAAPRMPVTPPTPEPAPRYRNPFMRPRSAETGPRVDPRTAAIEREMSSHVASRRKFMQMLGGVMIAVGAAGGAGLAAKYLMGATDEGGSESSGLTINQQLGLPEGAIIERLTESPSWYGYPRNMQDPNTGQLLDSYEIISPDGSTAPIRTEPGVMVNGRMYYKLINEPYYMISDSNPSRGVSFVKITQTK